MFYSTVVFSQNNKIDSLKKQMEICENDTCNFNYRNNLINYFVYKNYDSAHYYIFQCFKKYKFSGYEYGFTVCSKYLSRIYADQSKYWLALKILHKSFRLLNDDNNKVISVCKKTLNKLYINYLQS